MLPLIPHRYNFDNFRLAAITRFDVIKAHNLAPELILAISQAQGRHSRAQALNLVVTTTLPLMGYLLLNWSGLLIVLALVLDYAATRLGDGLKHRWDPDLVRAEISRAADTEMAVTVATALKYPARSRQGTREFPQCRVLVHYVEDSDERSIMRSKLRSMMLVFGSIVLPLFFLVLLIFFTIKPREDLSTLLLMMVPALINLGVARFQSIHAAVDGTPNPQLYPQAKASFVVLLAGSMLFGFVGMLITTVNGGDFMEGVDRKTAGGIYLCCFFVVSACVAVLSQKRNARWLEALTEFAATRRERLLATLSTFNPDERETRNNR